VSVEKYLVWLTYGCGSGAISFVARFSIMAKSLGIRSHCDVYIQQFYITA
jgi:hypothetical protein